MISEKRLLRIGFIVLLVLLLAIMAATIIREIQNAKVFIRDRELPSAGLSIAAKLEMQEWELSKAAESLSHDSALIEWLESPIELRDPKILHTLLLEYKNNFKLDETGLVCARTEVFFGSAGETVQMSRGNELRDSWYYLFTDNVLNRNLDTWVYPDSGAAVMYMNVPVFSADARYIGCVGVGVSTDIYKDMLRSFEHAWELHIYLARRDGQLIYASDYSLLSPQPRNVEDILHTGIVDKVIRDRANLNGLVMDFHSQKQGIIWGRFLEDQDTLLFIEHDYSFIKDTYISVLITVIFTGTLIAVIVAILLFLVYRLSRARLDVFIQESKKKDHKLQAIIAVLCQLAESRSRHLARLIGHRNDIPSSLSFELEQIRGELFASQKALRSMLDSEKTSDPQLLSLDACLQDIVAHCLDIAGERGVTVQTVFDFSALGSRKVCVYARFALDHLLSAIASEAKSNTAIIFDLQGTPTQVRLEIAATLVDDLVNESDKRIKSFIFVTEHFLHYCASSMDVLKTAEGAFVFRVILKTEIV